MVMNVRWDDAAEPRRGEGREAVMFHHNEEGMSRINPVNPQAAGTWRGEGR